MLSLTLEILQGDEPRSVTFSTEQIKSDRGIIIGRNPDSCDLVFKDKKVSRFHGKIFFKEKESTFYLQNLTYQRPNAKPNPIFVNNKASFKNGVFWVTLRNTN